MVLTHKHKQIICNTEILISAYIDTKTKFNNGTREFSEVNRIGIPFHNEEYKDKIFIFPIKDSSVYEVIDRKDIHVVTEGVCPKYLEYAKKCKGVDLGKITPETFEKALHFLKRDTYNKWYQQHREGKLTTETSVTQVTTILHKNIDLPIYFHVFKECDETDAIIEYTWGYYDGFKLYTYSDTYFNGIVVEVKNSDILPYNIENDNFEFVSKEDFEHQVKRIIEKLTNN